MTIETYREHCTQWLQLRRNMTRVEAERLVASNADYLAGAHERGVDSIRAANLIHALATYHVVFDTIHRYAHTGLRPTRAAQIGAHAMTQHAYFTVSTKATTEEVEAYLYNHTAIIFRLPQDDMGSRHFLLETTVTFNEANGTREQARAEAMRLAQYQADRLASGLHGVSQVYEVQADAVNQHFERRGVMLASVEVDEEAEPETGAAYVPLTLKHVEGEGRVGTLVHGAISGNGKEYKVRVVQSFSVYNVYVDGEEAGRVEKRGVGRWQIRSLSAGSGEVGPGYEQQGRLADAVERVGQEYLTSAEYVAQQAEELRTAQAEEIERVRVSVEAGRLTAEQGEGVVATLTSPPVTKDVAPDQKDVYRSGPAAERRCRLALAAKGDVISQGRFLPGDGRLYPSVPVIRMDAGVATYLTHLAVVSDSGRVSFEYGHYNLTWEEAVADLAKR